MQFYIDPAGDDSGPGTIDQPFATLDRARAEARPGTVITLRAGTYRLTEPLSLSDTDSGVTFQAHDGEEVVISGGRIVTGWGKGADGVWTAPVPGVATRQLYVSGRRAARASRVLDMPLRRTDTGYVLPEPQSWHGEMELVYHGVYPWSHARCPVDSLDGTVITMAQPAFTWASRLYQSIISWEGPGAGETNGADNPTSIENSPAFLTEGTFALADGVLHYLPRPGEDLDAVVAPVLETLIRAGNAHDIAFRGITFADTTWLRPSSGKGFLHYHGNGYYDGGEIMTVTFAEGAGQVEVPTDPASMPGALHLRDCSRISFDNCHLTRLGGVALEFHGGTGNTVRDSEISVIAGGGVVIGGDARDCRIDNTHIHHIGLDYHGSPAVLTVGTRATVIAHNEINDVPHAGIVVYDGTSAQVLNNLVHDTMQVLADGGGIYIAGSQGTSHADGALIRGNVVRDTVTPYNYALYTDYGASWITVQGNVIHRNDNPAVLQVSPPLEHVAFLGNYWDADPGDAPDSVTLADNTVLTEPDFATHQTVASIVVAAGRH
ncbi:right-handed parallel beta-helix repeat-containing protein [Kibdelosporangium aridum]|uniref:Right-handed parallel beta-helix repeat-containing protein n=1 Tax=Kibdelosporangium aridum TaxID=2030 RepID=A0A428Z1M4_KIBAR|nr:right-handed parallel beta-helix repeat-containing protein [Kibdelosporangium aridum]RSM78695.1 right-handed parallel beta-helix repeat-containing protein [Kibdelosporangium aridum]